MCGQMDRASIHAEMELARGTFQALVARASPSNLRRPALGTRWTNQQLLFHLLFVYMVVLRLLPVVRFFGRVPDRYSPWFAQALNAGAWPFHVVNYLGCSANSSFPYRTKFGAVISGTSRNGPPDRPSPPTVGHTLRGCRGQAPDDPPDHR